MIGFCFKLSETEVRYYGSTGYFFPSLRKGTQLTYFNVDLQILANEFKWQFFNEKTYTIGFRIKSLNSPYFLPIHMTTLQIALKNLFAGNNLPVLLFSLYFIQFF